MTRPYSYLTQPRIHKSKYSEDVASPPKSHAKKEKKSRSKSRSRNLFGLRRDKKEDKENKDISAAA